MSDHPSMKMKAEKRAALFDVAAQEFTEFGFEQASLNSIIGKVGMSKSSFYHYFAGKSELFQQILLQTFAPLTVIAAESKPEVLNAENFWSGILQDLGSMGAIEQYSPEVLNAGRMYFQNLAVADKLCAELMEVPTAFIARLLKHGQSLGVIRQDLPSSLLVNAVMALGMEIDRWGLENVKPYDSEEITRFNKLALDMFLRILSPAPADAEEFVIRENAGHLDRP
jgi:AcrR family transcriptional regulator